MIAMPTVPTAAQRAAIREAHGPGKHVFKECAVCGLIEWTCTYGADPDDVEVVLRSDNCPRCVSAATRAPEVFEWVLGVASRLQRVLGRSKEIA